MYYRNGLNLWYPSYLGETNIPKSGFKSDGQAIGQAAKHSSVREINDRKGYLAFKHRRALGSYATSWEIMVFWNVLIEKLDEHGSYTVIHRHNYVMVLKYLIVGVTSIAVRVLLGLP